MTFSLLLSVALATPTISGSDGPSFEKPEVTAPSGPSGGADAQIIHGDDATSEQFPATGGMLFAGHLTVPNLFGGGTVETDARQFACSSTLIAPDVVLLAAHCVDPAVLAQGGSVEDLEFRWSRKANLTKPSTPDEAWPDDAIKASKAVFPRQWSINNMQDFSLDGPKYDIALLFLEDVVTDVDPAIVIEPDQGDQIKAGLEVDIVGWGLVNPIGLMDSFTPPEPGSFGKKQLAHTKLAEIGEFEMQVGQKPESGRKCRGDSGGPTFATLDGQQRLIGVTSRSADFTLCETEGGFDTRVDAYLDWLDNTMTKACEDGERIWCDEPGVLTVSPWAEDEEGNKKGCATVQGGGWLLALAALFGLRRRH